MKKYIPKPVDTSDTQLPEDLEILIELMAENVHEIWAQERISQGWIYGPTRDDRLKQHPCLVPYGELDENEKVFDRNSAVETLKLILKYGYSIKKSQ